MISKDLTYAVVGASDDPEKYGYKVFKDLIDADYNAIPVNIHGKTILGYKSFKRLQDIDQKVDVVITVVKPDVTLQVVKDAHAIGVANIWMQPGSENEEAIEFCIKNGISYISNACIMVQKGKMSESAISK